MLPRQEFTQLLLDLSPLELRPQTCEFITRDQDLVIDTQIFALSSVIEHVSELLLNVSQTIGLCEDLRVGVSSEDGLVRFDTILVICLLALEL